MEDSDYGYTREVDVVSVNFVFAFNYEAIVAPQEVLKSSDEHCASFLFEMLSV